ncbi:hypothetical protein GCM10007933_35040 [Zoogloea oryzae]|uniref:HNH endonuclease n=1 Tax=Zoogloea oryzae TaxID=310767 RepID=A0ABQ6FEJ8_9RHOO|nr:hypothetical protein [Zoogloea oryzae]GLT24033.1 hypothetical protein GCM10007933_35040 [Zoogloea oryzae]
MDTEIDWPTKPCKHCHAVRHWGIRRYINLGGSQQFVVVCEWCGARTNQYIKAKVIRALNLIVPETLPDRPRHRCVVCNADGAENHHWAPQALFGSEADRWPQSYLCPRCHKRWHDIVTPGISARRGL